MVLTLPKEGKKIIDENPFQTAIKTEGTATKRWAGKVLSGE
jgi:hypothetical protein